MPIHPQYRKALRHDEKILLAGILSLEQNIKEIRDNIEFMESLKNMATNPLINLVRINPVPDGHREKMLKTKEYSCLMMKAQRCVIVHVLNGHKAKAEKWLRKFIERVTDAGEWMSENPTNHSFLKPDTGDVVKHQANENGYKQFMEERMFTYNVLKSAVDDM